MSSFSELADASETIVEMNQLQAIMNTLQYD